MPINILMPALSPTMEKGNLARWLKKEGDPVRSGDIIAEIETDKATMEVEAADEGVLAKIVVPAGTADVPVNEVIGLIAGEGEDPKSVGAPAREGGGSAPPAQPQGRSASQSVPPENKAPGPGPAGSLSYARVDEAPAGAEPGAPPAGSAPRAPAAPPPKPNGAAAPGGRVFASPLARRIAKEAGLDLTALKGSGPHGRIIER